MSIRIAALAATLTLAAVAAAEAHVTLETASAKVGSTYKAVLRVPHGCAGSPTLKVRVKVPEGLIAVKPQPKAGWQLETVKGKYAKTYDYYGTPMSEGVTEIVWTGRLLDEHYDEFVFRGTLAKDLVPGTKLPVPVVQDCETGHERWIDVPAEGQNPDSLKTPAPLLKLLPAE